jgi:RNA polymerase sigma-70 factor (ECF subfamily)
MPKQDFEELIERYDTRLFNVMYGMTGDYHRALDLTEEAFVKAMKAYPRFRGDSDPFTWLYRIAINVLKKQHRRESRRMELWDRHLQSDPPVDHDATTPHDVTIERERATAVRHAIAELPRSFREAITLRYIDQMTYEEIAAACGCSMGTVKSRIARAKMMLADLLAGKV